MLRKPRAVVFDLDGVLVDTARLHGKAWKGAFDSFFENSGLDDTFDEVHDYRQHVDGRPRYEGVAALLRSRGIELPKGDPEDEPGYSTEAAIGNMKNQMFHDLIESEGVEPLPGVRELLEAFSADRVPMAVVSSSRNAPTVLPPELGQYIDLVLGGDAVAELGIPGKPEPGMFIEGARRLGVEPSSAAVVEDAPAGVRAGRRGGFAITVGVDAEGTSHLGRAGADVVLSGFDALPHQIGSWSDLIEDPPSALASPDDIWDLVGDKPAVFLDYDGTLTPIVDDPAAATIGDREKKILEDLAHVFPVAIVSGRGLDDVKSLVDLEGLTYSGSHGFEIEMPSGERIAQKEASSAVPELDEAERLLVAQSAGLSGVMIERKPYAIAVHTRRAQSEEVRRSAGELARDVVSRFDGLVLRGGKEIHELRPALDWDKGAALSHLLSLLPGDPVPVYIGDDETDEDGFLGVRRESGLGILVGKARGAETWADFTLTQPEEVLEFLTLLADTNTG